MIDKQKIEDIMSTSTAVEPADDFTARVMATVMEAKPGFYHRVWNILASRRSFTLDPMRALHGGVSSDEIFLYFSMVAFAYLILAAVLFIGLKNTDSVSLISPLFLVQPWISLFLACGLGFAGFMARKMNIGIRLARIAAFIYIEIVVINGVLMFIELKPILFLMPLIITMVSISVGLGIFLAAACNRQDTGTGKINNSLT